CAIVSNSTSCGLMLKREAREILEVADDDVAVVSEAMYDLCEFLLLLHQRGELRTDFKPLELTVPYHAPCQQQGHGIGKPALDLFGLIPGLRAIELDADCCGIAGTYGLKKEKYEISMTVGERLFGQLRESNGDRAACGDGVLVLMDLGSAVLGAETALDFLTPEQRESVLLCEAPLVEGAVAAAVAARLGEPLAAVAKEARGGLQGKTAQLGAD